VFNAAIVAATTTGILELVLRLFGLTQPVLYEPDEHAGYRLKPNQRVAYLGNAIAIDRWGVRDGRDFDDGAKAMDRLLVLGDSVTWGGIREQQEHLFTSVVGREFLNLEVVNGGVNGYSVAQMAALYTHHLAPLNPDCIVVFAIPRDFTRPPISRLTGEGVGFPQRTPRSAVLEALSLVRYLAAERFDWTWLRPPPAAVPDRPDISMEESLEDNVHALTELMNSVGRDRLLVVLLPTAPGTPDVDKLDRIEEALRHRNVPFEDVADWAALGTDHYADGVHLTTEGHRIVGTALAEILRTRAVAGRMQPS